MEDSKKRIRIFNQNQNSVESSIFNLQSLVFNLQSLILNFHLESSFLHYES